MTSFKKDSFICGEEDRPEKNGGAYGNSLQVSNKHIFMAFNSMSLLDINLITYLLVSWAPYVELSKD